MEFEPCSINTFARVEEMLGKIPHLRTIACLARKYCTFVIGILEKKGILDVSSGLMKDVSMRSWIQQYLATLLWR